MKKQITRREGEKMFLNFLKKNKALKQYVQNIRKYRREEFKTLCNYANPLTLSRLADAPICEWINYAFCWANTPQSHSFWSKLNEKWCKIAFTIHDKFKTENIK